MDTTHPTTGRLGTAILDKSASKQPDVAMDDSIEYIKNEATRHEIDDLEIDTYTDDHRRVFEVYTYRNDLKYQFEVAHNMVGDQPTGRFKRSVNRSLQRFKERPPDQ